MAISVVQQNMALTNSGVLTQAVTFTGNTTTGNLVIVGINTTTAGANAIVTTGVTDSQGNTYQNAAVIKDSTNGRLAEIWYAMNITGGTTPTVTATFGNSISVRPNMFISEVSGIATVSALDVTNTFSTGASAVASPVTMGTSATTNQASELIYVSAANGNSVNVITAGSGYSNLLQQGASTTGKGFIESAVLTSTGTQSPTYSYSGSSTITIAAIATFKAPQANSFITGVASITGINSITF